MNAEYNTTYTFEKLFNELVLNANHFFYFVIVNPLSI